MKKEFLTDKDVKVLGIFLIIVFIVYFCIKGFAHISSDKPHNEKFPKSKLESALVSISSNNNLLC